MENYKVLQRLGKGAQGTVFLVEHKETRDKCVLKKVECLDDTQANKAFKEVKALQSLTHPYICGYREFFMVWDKEEQALFVCIVMDYYKLGDLDHALKQQRAKGEFLDDLVLKKWVGQMIEALHYVHDQKTIHRDLKPSNIFLKDDLSIAVGDFGVATVMGNIRTITRTAVGSMSWVAPEILDTTPQYDERTDVWSLGCILLEMATCGFLDVSLSPARDHGDVATVTSEEAGHDDAGQSLEESQPSDSPARDHGDVATVTSEGAQIGGVLFQLKDNPQIMEEILTTVAEHYSSDLCQTIRSMLRRAFHQRPTSRELTELPFVQQCLALSHSPLYKGPASGRESHKVNPLAKDSGTEAVIAYMEENSTSLACQVHALQILMKQTESDPGVSGVGKKRVLQTMKDYGVSVEVQTLCCQVLCNWAITASGGDLLFTKEFIHPVCLAMRSHAGSVELQSSASALIMALSSDEGAAEILGQVGGIQDILAAMRLFPSNLEIVSSCCTALWSLSVIENNMLIITKERGVRDICSALQTHDNSKDLVDAACSALWSLSMEDDNLGMMADIGVVELLLQALEKYYQDLGVAKFACAALRSLSEVHDVSAFYVLQTESGLNGVPIILKALTTHADNGEVVENIAFLFQELARHKEIREELVSLKVDKALVKLRSKFSANEEGECNAKTAIGSALAALEGKEM